MTTRPNSARPSFDPPSRPRHEGNLRDRLLRGTRWSWRAPRHAASLPGDLDASVMGLNSADRLHRKQGRSTARFRFDAGASAGAAPVSVYLKRHYRLPAWDRLRALLHPSGNYSPGSAEMAHLEAARGLGISVPEVVAAGERIGPWGRLESYLMVAELVGQVPLNEAIPALARDLRPAAFAALKRAIVAEMAAIVARLHGAHAYHKDLYLCHFFVDPSTVADPPARSRAGWMTLIDLHRLAHHRWLAARWRAKDLGQLLYSTDGVDGITPRDRARFWSTYRKLTRLRLAGVEARLIRAKAARYGRHNRG